MTYGKLFQQCLKNTQQHFIPVAQVLWKVMIPIALCIEGFQYVYIEFLKTTGVEWAPPLGKALCDLMLNMILFLVIPPVIRDCVNKSPKTDLWAHFKKHLKPLTIEGCRVFGRVALYTLLLIVPGIIQSFKLYFVPWIIQFDEDYDNDKVDALQKSLSITQDRTTMFILLCIPIMLISFLSQMFKQTVEILSPMYIIGFLLVIVAEIVTHIMFYTLYISMNQRVQEKG
jgi:hypothetical protein